jgi:hypothetical protein
MNEKIRTLTDWFLLKRAEATVRGYGRERLASVKQLAQAASARVALADESTDATFAPGAVTLHREAIRLWGSALLVARGLAPPGPPLELPAVLATIEEMAARGELPPLPKRYADARAVLDTPEHLLFEGKDGIDRARGRSAVEMLTAWLDRQVESRNVLEIWQARIARFAGGLVALAVLVRVLVAALRMHKPGVG